MIMTQHWVIPFLDFLLILWIVLIAIVSIINGIQNYVSLKGAKKVYNIRTHLVTGLQSRNFGTWTITSGLVRCFAAYNISNPGLYHLAMSTFMIALIHFSLEVVIYRTTGWGALPPFIVASVSLGWMIKEQKYYLG